MFTYSRTEREEPKTPVWIKNTPMKQSERPVTSDKHKYRIDSSETIFEVIIWCTLGTHSDIWSTIETDNTLI